MVPHDLWALPIAFLVSLGMLCLLLFSGVAIAAMDQPNYRSLHTSPVPRTGGLAMLAGVFASWAWIDNPITVMQVCILVLMLVSFTDDLRNLGAGVRLTAQFFAVALLLWLDFTSGQHWLWLLCTAIAMVWVVNLYNFMDGIDGLAGGMALFGFGFYGLAAYLAGDSYFAVMSACIAAATAAFLLFNFHPARIFMGDAGSVPLGFLAGSMGLYGWQRGLWPVWFPALVFSPFVVDATVTLFKRSLRKEKIWQAHKSHYYQRLVQMGWGHRKMAIAEYVLMLATGSSAVLLLNQTMPIVLGVLAFWTLLYFVLMRIIDKRWSVSKRPGDAF